MMEVDTRLRVARGIAKDETQASIEVFERLQRRGHPQAPPPTVSDGWGGIDEAMIEVYGHVPPYSGRGRPPTHKQPGADWAYLQLVKQRDVHQRVTGLDARVLYGAPASVRAALPAQLSYVERTHLTMRHCNSRLTRKGLAFSKSVAMLRASAAWEDLVYNFARPVKSLRVERFDEPGKRWEPCTPAMAAGLTLHIWTVAELLTTIVAPIASNT